MVACTMRGARLAFIAGLAMAVSWLGGCGPSYPVPNGLGPVETQLWQAMHGEDVRVTIGGRVLRDAPPKNILHVSPLRVDPKGDRGVGGCVTESDIFLVTMRGHWKSGLGARETPDGQPRKNFTGVSVRFNRSPLPEEEGPQPARKLPAPATAPAPDYQGEVMASWPRPPSCTLLSADSNEPMEIACLTKDGRWLRKVDDNWYVIVALAGTRGLVCIDSPGRETCTGPYRRFFRRFSLRPFGGDPKYISRHCIEEHLPLGPSGKPAEPPLEKAHEVEFPDVIQASVLESMKGYGRPLTLGNTVVTEAPAAAELVGTMRVRPQHSSYIITETRIMEVSREWDDKDEYDKPIKRGIGVDLWIWPDINTDSGTGVWAQVMMPGLARGGPKGEFGLMQSFWLDARTPGHLESLFVRAEAGPSRQYVEDWSMALFVRNSDVLLAWRSNSTWKADKTGAPASGYRRLRIKGATDPKIQDACGKAYLEELFPASAATGDAPRKP